MTCPSGTSESGCRITGASAFTRAIVASVIQAEELGTPLSEVLHSQATLLRMQRSVRAENAAAVASVRILVPSLLILMSVILAVFSPMVLRAFRKGIF